MMPEAAPERASADPVSITPDRGPAVPLPPPLLFLGGFVAGVVASRLWPLAFPWPTGLVSLLVGLLLVVLGVALAAVGVITFRKANVAVYPNRPASSLVTHGVYQYTRNPMYVGMSIAYVGGVAIIGAVWSLILLPLVLVAVYVIVIRREERHLRERFPNEYQAYCLQVRRWI